MNQQERSAAPPTPPEPASLPYKTPRLRLLGTLSGLTKGHGSTGPVDGDDWATNQS